MATDRAYGAKKRAWQDTLVALEKRDQLGVGWALALATVAERECSLAAQLIMAHVHLGAWDKATDICRKQVSRFNTQPMLQVG